MAEHPRNPVILVAVDDEEARGSVVASLARYRDDYEIVGVAAGDVAGIPEGTEVALVLSDAGDPGRDEVFTAVRRRFPDARGGLLIGWGEWGDPATARRISALISALHVDYYVVRPQRPRDEAFHRRVTELLRDWDRAGQRGDGGVTLVGWRGDPRAHQLAAQLARYGIGHRTEPGEPDTPPELRMPEGRTLVDPSDAELARVFAFTTDLPSEQVDLVVVGCGPGGLAASVYASSEGLNTVALERASVGGQAGSSSLIRNYLGFERGISGADLAQRAYQQAWVFGTRYALTREATGLDLADDGFVLRVAPDETLRARAVVLATGVSYRRLPLGELDRFVGACVFYGASATEAKGQSGRIVHVVGGGNSAGQAALHLARYAASVSLIVRGAALAESMSAYLIEQLHRAGVEILTEAKVVGGAAAEGSADRLDHIVVRHRGTGVETTLRSDALFITIGAVPHTSWLPAGVLRDRWGFVFTGDDMLGEGGRRAWPLERAPTPLESSIPGLFAVGDARRGSIKRVASAVGEGSVVVSAVHRHLAERR